jgi:tetratricopeptide (TPR) repeat protein
MQEPNSENTSRKVSMSETENTIPTHVSNEPVDPTFVEVTQPFQTGQPGKPQPKNKKTGPRRWPWVLLGILVVLLFGAAGGWFGYQSAIQLRKAKSEEAKVTDATEHFMLGLQAQQNKQYEIAQQQFEYVIQRDPSFPGAQDKLQEVLLAMAVARTPTVAPTVMQPTMTPTKDLRPLDEIFNQARQQLANKDWNGVFTTIDSLRQSDPKFKAVEVDGMLYVALRQRGIDKILNQANPEGGLYDLALAEKIGPLDKDSLSYRNWARMYLNGSTFWEIDWLKVMNYFEQIYPAFPNMRDSSGLTAIERYRIAARSYADQLVAKGDKCGAKEYYEKSLNAVPDGALAQTATQVAADCSSGEVTPEPTTGVPTNTPQVAASPTTAAASPEPTQATQPTPEPPTPEPPTAEPPTPEPPTPEPPTAAPQNTEAAQPGS